MNDGNFHTLMPYKRKIMSEDKFAPGMVVKHVNPGFRKVNLYVVKRLESGSYKCRYLAGESFCSDEFESYELKDIADEVVNDPTILSVFQ
jgi:hypothetical protein